MENPLQVQKHLLVALNQLYEIEQKIEQKGDNANLRRNVDKMKDAFENLGLTYEDPMGLLPSGFSVSGYL